MPGKTPDWKRNLIESYRHSLRCVAQAAAVTRSRMEKSPGDHTKEAEDLRLLGEAAGDVAYGLTWLRHGNPGDVHLRPRLKVVETRVIETRPPVRLKPSGPISDETMILLKRMSVRERQVYLMFYTEGLSKHEIARKLGVTRQSVQTLLERASGKVS